MQNIQGSGRTFKKVHLTLFNDGEKIRTDIFSEKY